MTSSKKERELGHIAYDAYHEHVKDMVKLAWDDLPTVHKEKWIAAAKAVVDATTD